MSVDHRVCGRSSDSSLCLPPPGNSSGTAVHRARYDTGLAAISLRTGLGTHQAAAVSRHAACLLEHLLRPRRRCAARPSSPRTPSAHVAAAAIVEIETARPKERSSPVASFPGSVSVGRPPGFELPQPRPGSPVFHRAKYWRILRRSGCVGSLIRGTNSISSAVAPIHEQSYLGVRA